jgi:hypothetical protein
MPTPTYTDMPNMNKCALLIAFHFPPQSESSGIQRTLSFAKNLGESGWTPMVLSADPMAYERKNDSQLRHLPAGLIVKRPCAFDTKRHFGLFGRYPETIALPDRWVSWWPFAVPAALALIRTHRPAVLWSTFPIATAHLIGLTLQRLTGLPWIADFRDPMLQDNYPRTGRQRKTYQWIERQTIARCTRAVFTTQGALEAYKNRFPAALHHKFEVIENGYDEEAFVQTEAAPAATDSIAAERKGGGDGNGSGNGNRIVLLHSGVLYEDGRDPAAFLRALLALKRQGRIDAGNFRVILRAPGALPYFRGLVKTCEVEDIVMIEPPVAYQTALREMLAADGLLVFQGTPFNTQIPAKIYEYFRARKPILGLLDPAGETAKALGAAGFSHLAAMNCADAIVPILDDFIGAIEKRTTYIASEALIAASSRRHRARSLARIFEQAVGADRAGR